MTFAVVGTITLVFAVAFTYGFLQDFSKSLILVVFVNVWGAVLAFPSIRLLRDWQRRSGRAELPTRYDLQLILLCFGVSILWFFPAMEFSKRILGNGPMNFDRATASLIGIPVMFAYSLVWAYSYTSILDSRAAAKASQRYSEAESEIYDLAALLDHARIQPHFLYNTLSLIRQEITNHSGNALPALDSLSDFLRLTTDLTDEPVTLEQEFAFTESYLRIHEQRMAGILKANLKLVPSAKLVMVPPLILQPLAENALKHGKWEKGRVFELDISAVLEGSEVLLTVRSPGILETRSEREGHGLTGLRARLTRHSPDTSVSLSSQGNWVVAEIKLSREGVEGGSNL